MRAWIRLQHVPHAVRRNSGILLLSNVYKYTHEKVLFLVNLVGATVSAWTMKP